MQQTLMNLAAAFIGESQARNRYTIYAKTAQKEGYEQLAEVFLTTADQEREHAKWLMRLINGIEEKTGEKASLKVAAEVPTTVGTSAENLKAAIAGENHEHTSMYPDFAKVASEEGLHEIAARLKSIARAEAHHEERYKKYLSGIEAGSIFKKKTKTFWTCRKCGYEHEGNDAPVLCPSCSHPTGYFQVKCEEY